MAWTQSLIRHIDSITDWTGRWLAWAVLLMALLTTLVVVLRYGFSVGSIATQEAVTYLHGSLFMLGSAYTLKHGGHVRVDIFYRRFGPRAQAWVNSLGGVVLLLPLCLFIGLVSWNYVLESWAVRETSSEPGGIPAVFLLKTLLLLLAANLFLQGLAETLRSALVLVEEEAH